MFQVLSICEICIPIRRRSVACSRGGGGRLERLAFTHLETNRSKVCKKNNFPKPITIGMWQCRTKGLTTPNTQTRCLHNNKTLHYIQEKRSSVTTINGFGELILKHSSSPVHCSVYTLQRSTKACHRGRRLTNQMKNGIIYLRCSF